MDEYKKMLSELDAYAKNYLIFHDRESLEQMNRITGELLSLIEVLDGD